MSNMQSWAETFAPVHARNRQIVFENTWGHLAPKKNTSYSCEILFMYSEYGNLGATLIDTKLGDGLEDSPWLYDFINDQINEFDIKDAGVYLIKGTFRNFRLYGNPKKIAALA